ncbi:nucleotidyltransferase family protein [Nanoarchaeota archaeon]
MVGQEIWGLIPAAGKGERLRPLTDEVPKCLVEVNGRTLLETAILTLKAMGVQKIAIAVSYMKEKIIEFIESKDFGIDIQFAYPDKLLGLAYSVYSAKDIVSGTVVMMLPDNIYTEDCKYALDKHISEGALVSLIVEEGDPENRYETIKLEGDMITDIVEKASFSYGWRGTAIYIFESGFFRYFDELEVSIRGETEFQDTIIQAVKDGEKVLGVKIKGRRYDITEPGDIAKAEAAIKSKE